MRLRVFSKEKQGEIKNKLNRTSKEEDGSQINVRIKKAAFALADHLMRIMKVMLIKMLFFVLPEESGY